MLEDLLIDRTSFWIGFLAGLFGWIAYSNGKPLFSALKIIIGNRLAVLRAGLSTSSEHRYRQDVLKLMQRNHTASPLFSLTEVAIEPRLIAPPHPIIPDGAIPPDDITSMSIPYLPERPELSAAFDAETFSLAEAMSEGRDLILIGNPGSGKSFALCHLAYHIARRDPSVGDLKNLFPIYIHAGDLNLPANEKNLTDALYKVLYDQVSTLVEAQLPGLLESAFESQIALLILDDLDELPPEAQKPYLEYLAALEEAYPGNRYLITASPESIPQIDNLNLFPIPVSGWTRYQAETFFANWAKLWQNYVLKQSWAKSLPDKIDPLILHNWLSTTTRGYNPMYATLKAWGVYAGDLKGPTTADSIAAYVDRLCGDIKNAEPALEQLALQSALSQSPVLTRKAAGESISTFESDEPDPILEPEPEPESETAPPLTEEMFDDDDFDKLLDELDDFDESEIQEPVEEEEEEEIVKSKKEKRKSKKSSSDLRRSSVRRILPELVSSTIMAYRGNGKITFTHPVIRGYFAGKGFAARGGAERLLSQPSWSGRTIAWEFVASHGDIAALAEGLAEGDRHDPLRRGLMMMGSWPRYAPKSAPWRSAILRRLASVLQYESLAMGLRTRILTQLAFSGEAGIGSLFRQLMDSPQPSVRSLGALGSGLIQDTKAISALSNIIYDNSVAVSRAVCLALVSINTAQSLELVAEALLNGSEEVRRAAAEALAKHPEEGHPVLKEGAAMEDVLIRRAIVYGLARVDQPWALELLDYIQLEDDQWVVRNAANQTLEDLKTAKKSIPVPLPPIHEIPWLITFASKKGIGVAPGQAALDMLATALREGTEEHKLAAMDVFRQIPHESQDVLLDLYDLINGFDEEIREAAYNTVWHAAAAGLELPAAQ